MKRILFILSVLAVLFATAALLYPSTNNPWTGYALVGDGKYVSDSSHRTLDECRKYVQSHAGGKCGLECGPGLKCKQLVDVPELTARF